MIEIIDDGIAINEYDNSDLLILSDDDVVPPRPWRIHKSEYERANNALRQFQLSKLPESEAKTYDLSDVCESSNLAQSNPEDVVLIDFREVAASMRITYGEYKEWMKRVKISMTEAFVTRGSLF